jgi:hypothetical protein
MTLSNSPHDDRFEGRAAFTHVPKVGELAPDFDELGGAQSFSLSIDE